MSFDTSKINIKMVEVAETVEVCRCDGCGAESPTARAGDGKKGAGFYGGQFNWLSTLEGWFEFIGPYPDVSSGDCVQMPDNSKRLQFCGPCSGRILEFIKAKA